MQEVGGLEVIQDLNSNSKTHIVILHGYGANANDLYSLKQFFDPDTKYNWHFPNGFLDLGSTPGFESKAWFPIDAEAYAKAQAEGRHRDLAGVRPAGLNEARDRLLKFLKEILGEGDQLILGGFSQGAMLSTELSFQVASVLKGLIVLSGALLDEKFWVPNLSKLKGVPFIQSHGESDPVLSFDEAKRLYEFFKESELEGDFLDFQGGHEIPMYIAAKTKEFIEKHA